MNSKLASSQARFQQCVTKPFVTFAELVSVPQVTEKVSEFTCAGVFM